VPDDFAWISQGEWIGLSKIIRCSSSGRRMKPPSDSGNEGVDVNVGMDTKKTCCKYCYCCEGFDSAAAPPTSPLPHVTT
jgi:hypothetical protein